MTDFTLLNNTSNYRTPAGQSVLQGQNVIAPAAVYSKILLKTIEIAEKDFVFDSLASERLMPANSGSKEITFKRFLALAAHTIPLAEGIPPASDKGGMVAIKGTYATYGRVMKFTDQVNWKVADPIVSEYTRQLALKVPETKDILAQSALLAESQPFYASAKEKEGADKDILVPVAGGEVTHIKFLDTRSNPTIDEFRKIVLSMEAAKVKPRIGSNFLALVSPAVVYDLITDKRTKEFMKWQSTATAYTNDMVVDLFSLIFRKAKTIKTDNTFVDKDGVLRYIYHNPTTKRNALSTIQITTETSFPAETVIVDLTTKANVASPTAADLKVDGFDMLNIHHSFVVGEDVLYRIGVEGHSTAQFIKKEPGSAGTSDPLNQQQSVGWKLDSLGYKVANPDAIVDYMSVPSQYRVNVNARPDLKNQFLDYFYGYKDAAGNYYHPDQVAESRDTTGAIIYYVKGIGTIVNAVKMDKLIAPINGGRILDDGTKPYVVGDLPNKAFALKSNAKVRFLEDQIGKHTDGKFYIKGLEGTTTAEVVALPVSYIEKLPTADGTKIKNTTVITTDGRENLTGHKEVDDK